MSDKNSITEIPWFAGQRGSGRADVFTVLSPHGWQAHHHYHQSQKSQSYGHHWSLRWVLPDNVVFLLRGAVVKYPHRTFRCFFFVLANMVFY